MENKNIVPNRAMLNVYNGNENIFTANSRALIYKITSFHYSIEKSLVTAKIKLSGQFAYNIYNGRL